MTIQIDDTVLGTPFMVDAAPPTFLSLHEASGALTGVETDEQDVVFFGTPPSDARRLTGQARTTQRTMSGDDEPARSRVDRVIEYRDHTGHLIAEVFHSGIAESPAVESAGPPISNAGHCAGVLARYATARFGAGAVRRFRTRIVDGAIPVGSLTCTASIVQEYEKDLEHVADVALVCIDQSGQVAARAWATFATATW